MLKALAIALAFASLSLCVHAQDVKPGPPAFNRLFSTTTSSANGADLTEDVLTSCAYTVPAGQLANVGDTLHILASGAMGGTTDAKTARLKLAGVQLQSSTGATGSGQGWVIEATVVKRGINQQSSVATGLNNAQAVLTGDTLPTITDTATMAISVTGQNATNSVAGSVTCNFLVVDFIRGS